MVKKYNKYDKNVINKAVNECFTENEHVSFREIATKYKIKPSTLKYHYYNECDELKQYPNSEKPIVKISDNTRIISESKRGRPKKSDTSTSEIQYVSQPTPQRRGSYSNREHQMWKEVLPIIEQPQQRAGSIGTKKTCKWDPVKFGLIPQKNSV